MRTILEKYRVSKRCKHEKNRENKGNTMKNRKKMLVWPLCVAMICLLAACGSVAGEVTTSTPEMTEAAIVESTEETTEAPTKPPTRQVAEIKVGMIS